MDNPIPELQAEQKGKPKCKKCGFIVGLVIALLVIAEGVTIYMYLNKEPSVTTLPPPPDNTPPVVVDDTPTPQLEGTVKYETLPTFTNATSTSDMKLDGGGRRISYETPDGTTSKQVMDFYETELKKLGWQRVIRDVDNKQLEMFGGDQSKLRVWIYYEGTDLDGADKLPLTFIVDFGPPMGEYLPVPIQ